MAVYYCVKCGALLIDPDIYCKVGKKGGKKTLIKCPCGYKQTLEQMTREKLRKEGHPDWKTVRLRKIK